MKLMNSFAQINPQISFVEHAKAFPGALQQVVAIVMECQRMNRLAQQRADAISHLSSSRDGIGEGDDVLGLRVSLLDQVGDAVDQNGSLPRARAREYQHWSVDVLDRFALATIGKERGGARLWFGDSHRGPEYHHDRQRAGKGRASLDRTGESLPRACRRGACTTW